MSSIADGEAAIDELFVGWTEVGWMAPMVPRCVAADTRGDVPAMPLPADESAAIAHAVPTRVREFTIGRTMARLALSRLGVTNCTLPRGARREPVWPAGLVGSITHCDGYTAAVAANRDAIHSVGIDAEVARPLTAAERAMVLTAGDRHALARCPDDGTAWDSVVFSAKESVYKTWFPLTRRWLGMEDATITILPGCGAFVATLLVPGPAIEEGQLRVLEGRFTFHERYVLTAVTLPAGPSLTNSAGTDA